jgi:threonylcarbamoyladenosine tRNA methylthiotransferase MtaB
MAEARKKVAFHTLGCKLNFAETSTISRSFPEEKYERVSANEHADIFIINTCSVTDVADRKCRQAIKKFINRSPDAFIAVVGCYAQLNPQEVSSIPGVDLVLGTNEKFDLAKYIEDHKKGADPEIHSCALSEEDSFSPSFSMGDRTRSFLKVQDGCDYGCSYCTIPAARGTSRNPSIRLLIEEAESIAAKGISEIVLTGVNIGDFGKSTGENFVDLIKQLTYVEGIERIRLSSIEPNLIGDELISIVSENRKILPHFHIPLQSGNNRILGLMRRRYQREIFAEKVNKIRTLIPYAGIGADVIVGFPGETDADFDITHDFLAELPLSYLHVFSYSQRPGTVSESLPDQVSHSEKEKRSRILSGLSEEKHASFCRINIGTYGEVLFERTKSEGLITGFTGNYLRVEYPWDPSLAGKIMKVRVTGIARSGNLTVDLVI